MKNNSHPITLTELNSLYTELKKFAQKPIMRNGKNYYTLPISREAKDFANLNGILPDKDGIYDIEDFMGKGFYKSEYEAGYAKGYLDDSN